jgi:hypothetical protein
MDAPSSTSSVGKVRRPPSLSISRIAARARARGSVSERRTVRALPPQCSPTRLHGSRRSRAAAQAAGRLRLCQHQNLSTWRRRRTASQAELLRRPLAQRAFADDGCAPVHRRLSGAQESEMCPVDALLPLERRCYCEVAFGPVSGCRCCETTMLLRRRWYQHRPEALEVTLISAVCWPRRQLGVPPACVMVDASRPLLAARPAACLRRCLSPKGERTGRCLRGARGFR